MSKNIKEIGKELLGKSLNSFHRKTGLPQLERNNEMQDGILNGILSQVDDAYIEKTEQSNVIHLDGSGDGVVVLDSIEGNTMVNIIKQNDYRIDNSVIYRQENSIRIKRNNSSSRHFAYLNINNMWKENTIYTMVYIVETNTFTEQLELNNNTGAQFDPFLDNGFKNFIINGTGVFIDKLTTKPKSEWHSTPMLYCTLPDYDETNLDQYIDFKMIVLEGDWTDKEIPPFIEGLQSSFEEKVNDEGKYEIEILMKNRNLFDITKIIKGKYQNHNVSNGAFSISTNSNWKVTDYIEVQEGETYYNKLGTGAFYDKNKNPLTYVYVTNGQFTVPSGAKYVVLTNGIDVNWDDSVLQLKSITNTTYIPHKSNKIKLLINEPLRAVGDIKDKLCIINNKLMVERNCVEHQYSTSERIYTYSGSNYNITYFVVNDILKSNGSEIISDKLVSTTQAWAGHNVGIGAIRVNGENRIIHSHEENKEEFLSKLNTLLPKYVYELEEPYYEEVLNEYGEPIILEGYENGTLYIDSTIIPTTTVRYTPKMESFKTLKEVNKNNNSITLDINENIIPYMMDVDYMIMEKELCLLNTKNIRKMEVLDMTSMQKRTQEMLERLIKGKTLTEQECKTRVTTYLNAGKITDEQAEELMLVISEIYN